jgi:hypothetical protein
MNSSPWPAARREVANLSAPPPPGGAGAHLIDPPDRHSDADPPHAPRPRAGDTRRDDCSQRHCPHRMTRYMGTDLKTTAYPRSTPAPVSRRQIVGLPAGHLKDASGAASGGRAPPGP